MNSQQIVPAVSVPVVPVALAIPVLGDTPSANGNLATVATFAAFKVAEQLSFIRQYDPRVTTIAGYRHAVIRFRNTDAKATPKTAQMVTVPQLVLPEEFSLLPEKAIKVLMGAFEDAQDSIIRSRIDIGAHHVPWDCLELDKVLDFLTAVRMSQRLTKEGVENWFKIAAKDVCTIRANQIAESKGFDATQSAMQVAGTINAYCALATKLSAPVPNLGENEAKALKNLLVVGALSDDMAKVLLAKLEQILNPKITENTDL